MRNDMVQDSKKYYEGTWHDEDDIGFNLPPEYDRVKPEPVKAYVATWFTDRGPKASQVSNDKDALARFYGKERG